MGTAFWIKRFVVVLLGRLRCHRRGAADAGAGRTLRSAARGDLEHGRGNTFHRDTPLPVEQGGAVRDLPGHAAGRTAETRAVKVSSGR